MLISSLLCWGHSEHILHTILFSKSTIVSFLDLCILFKHGLIIRYMGDLQIAMLSKMSYRNGSFVDTLTAV
jgi:hypothetical protein